MSDKLNNETEIEKERKAQLYGKIWLVIIIVMVLVVFFELYSRSQGKSELRSILMPIGMIFLGLSLQVFIARNRTLRYIFSALSIIFFVGSLVTLFTR